MHRAFELARQWLHTHPNPRVGAIVVSASGDVVGEGWHRGPGTDHAEVVALTQAGDAARGSTTYVSLEPCSHHGRTPPCVEALISAGVSTVVTAATDPDPRVSGEGVKRLREAGVEVVVEDRSHAAREVDPAYFHHRETGMPMVTVKWAMTVDGAISAQDGTSQWITGEVARKHAHELRSLADGVVVGAGTLRSDDPRLDVRLSSYEGRQPRPIIIAGNEELPSARQIWERNPIVVSTSSRPVPSGQVVVVAGTDSFPDPVETCRALGDEGFLGLLVEGGPTLIGEWWRAGVVVNGYVHIGAKVGGGTGRSPLGGKFATLAQAEHVEFADPRIVGDDMVIFFERRG